MSDNNVIDITSRLPSNAPLNVLGTKLELCCSSPKTGFFRDGFCRTDNRDVGKHTVCSKLDAAFLNFSMARGNDLITPNPAFNFPGLKPGDRWCLCVERWKEALKAGCAPKVYLRATHKKALDYVDISELKQHALDLI